jgi:SAM-dependent methyltransferase
VARGASQPASRGPENVGYALTRAARNGKLPIEAARHRARPAAIGALDVARTFWHAIAMTQSNTGGQQVRPDSWDALARSMREPQFQEQIAFYKRREGLDLVSAWAPPGVRAVLKTDLFEEGFGQDALLDSFVATYPVVIGMDVSGVVTAEARKRIQAAGYVVSDACALPFKEGSFDLIVSISTLDHLPPPLLAGALAELNRTLRTNGCLVLTLDSGHNPLHVFSNHLRRWLGRIYAERCYTVPEVRKAMAGQPWTVTDVTAIYHVPFPVNFLAKRAAKLLGARADGPIRAVVRACEAVGTLPTRFFTGRYIALRLVKSA